MDYNSDETVILNDGESEFALDEHHEDSHDKPLTKNINDTKASVEVKTNDDKGKICVLAKYA